MVTSSSVTRFPTTTVYDVDSSSPVKKTLAIVSPGATLATGKLIYKVARFIALLTRSRFAYSEQCGGIDLPVLFELQEKGINDYEDAVQYLRHKNKELFFCTLEHGVTVKGISTSTHRILAIQRMLLRRCKDFAHLRTASFSS
jgi:hypothetical protein